MRSLPPVTNAALAFAAGVALSRFGALVTVAPLLVALLLLAPIGASRSLRGPWTPWMFVAAGLIGGLSSPAADDCSLRGKTLTGHFLATPRGGAVPFRVEHSGCDIRVVTRSTDALAGQRARVEGAWRPARGDGQPWFLATSAQLLPGRGREWRWFPVRWRAALVERLHRRYGDRGALVSALILARKEGLAPELREAFARTGIAHLLAISGFHVGVVSGLILALVRSLRITRRRASLVAAIATWLYVALIGFPDAACRAALIIALLSLSRARARPPARWGALGAALLVLLVLDPRRLWSPGFQLSFCGAAGLVAWGSPIRQALRRIAGPTVPEGLATGLAAGAAATLATIPVVAWHFERVSLVGIPATLAATPFVALAVPGALVSLVLEFPLPVLAGFLAGGVDALLACLEIGTEWLAQRSWVSVWTTQTAVRVAAVGLSLGALATRAPRVRGRVRRMSGLIWVVTALVAWPTLLSMTGRGTLEMIILDVGQGDAIAIRTPHARWVLVDAGPAGGSDPGAHPVVRALRSRGARRLEALVLTHPDLDHIGGARDVLSSIAVGAVIDPGRPSPKRSYVELLELARARGVPWRGWQAGSSWQVDGVSFEVLAPTVRLSDGDTESNASSLVIHVRYGAFDALLTGDAPADVEVEVSGSMSGGFELLKVGHHGSDTSTDSLMLARLAPQLSVVSVGRRNRYGHPSARVLGRLRAAGTSILRTDLDGTVTVVARADGTFRVGVER
ncbi:MAG TPA: DNA internalization-related competence protein ComEC/Rec2 [Gemmatimonadetes bacterium]|nr:DNA internalization-related competence protein ComEC/Rec2 [Gemmatimonadota bacterium]